MFSFASFVAELFADSEGAAAPARDVDVISCGRREGARVQIRRLHRAHGAVVRDEGSINACAAAVRIASKNHADTGTGRGQRWGVAIRGQRPCGWGDCDFAHLHAGRYGFFLKEAGKRIVSQRSMQHCLHAGPATLPSDSCSVRIALQTCKHRRGIQPTATGQHFDRALYRYIPAPRR